MLLCDEQWYLLDLLTQIRYCMRHMSGTALLAQVCTPTPSPPHHHHPSCNSDDQDHVIFPNDLCHSESHTANILCDV